MEFAEVNIEKIEGGYFIEVFWLQGNEEWTEVGSIIKAKYSNHWVLLSEDGEPLAVFSTLEEAKQKAPELLAKYSMSFREVIA